MFPKVSKEEARNDRLNMELGKAEAERDRYRNLIKELAGDYRLAIAHLRSIAMDFQSEGRARKKEQNELESAMRALHKLSNIEF